MIVYKTTNLVNGKIYVGQTKFSKNKYYLGSGKILLRAIRKYGKENFTREIICECSTQEELDEMEKYWIRKLNTQNSNIGYNVEDGGITGSSGPMSEEEKEKRRIALKGKKRPPFSKEWCENISKGKLGYEPWNKGVPWDKPRQWINNGERDKLILVEEREMYPDWKDGRHFFTRKPAHRGRVWMNKNGETKMVEKDCVDSHLNDGWKKGRK